MAADEEVMVVPVELPLHGHNLEQYGDLTERKVPWGERVEVIKKQFPSVTRLDWDKAFHQDPGLMGKLVNDILKIGAAVPGKPGKRPSLPPGEVHERLRQLTGEDWSILPFPEAFRALAGERSIRGLAAKCNIDRNMVIKIQGGWTPTIATMEKIAKGFKKKPEYFADYRSSYVTGVIFRHLVNNPEASVALVRRVKAAVREAD